MRKSELGGSLVEITQQWAELGPDDKAKYTEQAAERNKQYETEMATFPNAEDIAQYFGAFDPQRGYLPTAELAALYPDG